MIKAWEEITCYLVSSGNGDEESKKDTSQWWYIDPHWGLWGDDKAVFNVKYFNIS